jgi:hypothetical protein
MLFRVECDEDYEWWIWKETVVTIFKFQVYPDLHCSYVSRKRINQIYYFSTPWIQFERIVRDFSRFILILLVKLNCNNIENNFQIVSLHLKIVLMFIF